MADRALGGGSPVAALSRSLNYDLNDRTEVTFHAMLDTDTDGDSPPVERPTRLVSRMGTEIPAVGTIAHVAAQGFVGSPFPVGAGTLNNRGQIVCQVTVEDGRGALLLATPRGCTLRAQSRGLA